VKKREVNSSSPTGREGVQRGRKGAGKTILKKRKGPLNRYYKHIKKEKGGNGIKGIKPDRGKKRIVLSEGNSKACGVP